MTAHAVGIAIKALLADSTVTALVGERVRPVPLPLKETLPAIAVGLASENDDYMLGGISRYPESAVNVFCVAATATAAQELGETVKIALRDKTGTLASNETIFFKRQVDYSDFEPDYSLHRRVMQFAIRWRP